MQNINSGGQNESRNGNTKRSLKFKNGTFRPYHKSDDKIQYIHIESIQILLNIYQSLQNIVYCTYPLMKNYCNDQQHIVKVICTNLDITRNKHITTLNSKNIVRVREKSYGLTHCSAKMLHQKIRKIFFKHVIPTFPTETGATALQMENSKPQTSSVKHVSH